eukprot:5318952-Pyramimonas_sp.AAC.1
MRSCASLAIASAKSFQARSPCHLTRKLSIFISAPAFAAVIAVTADGSQSAPAPRRPLPLRARRHSRRG